MARTRTDIKIPRVLETPLVIEPAEYPSDIVHKGDGVCSKAVSRERDPGRRLVPVHQRRRRRSDILYIGEMGDRAEPRRGVRDRDTGRLGDGCGERC